MNQLFNTLFLGNNIYNNNIYHFILSYFYDYSIMSTT